MDEALFRRMLPEIDPVLRGYVRSYARDDDHADDLVQEVWIEAWRLRHQVRDSATMAGWMLSICRTVCRRDKARWRRRTAALDAVEQPTAVDPEIDIEEEARALEARDDELLNRVVRLSPQQRSVLLLRYACDMPVAKVALMLGRSRATVKATLEQARRRVLGLPNRGRR